MFGKGNEEEKIQKLAEKKHSDKIIKLIGGSDDAKVVTEGLEALAGIADEDSNNFITSAMENANADIRIAAAKAACKVGTDYMKTHVQAMLGNEKDSKVADAIRPVYDAAFLK